MFYIISDYRMHVTSLMAVALFVYINHKYFTGFFRVFQPPIPIAIDSVTAIGIIAVTDGMLFAHIIALSRTYIVSTKGITVIFLGIFRHLYPWEKFKVIDVCPGFDECEGGIFMLMVWQHHTDSDGGWRSTSAGNGNLPLASHIIFLHAVP